MSDNAPDWNRVVEAAMFHHRLMREEPYTCGPYPEHRMRQLAEASAQMVNVRQILVGCEDLAIRTAAIEMAMAALWAHAFKTAVQAMGPADARG